MIPAPARLALTPDQVRALLRGGSMIPPLWRSLMPPPEPPDLPYRDPLRERWFPSWPSAMIHATLTAQRLGVKYEVRRDQEFAAWVARPRQS